MPGHSVRVVAPDVGGGFGGKASLYPEEIACLRCWRGSSAHGALDQRPAGRPASTTSQAFDEIVDAELALDRRRPHPRALRAEVIGDVGAYSIYPWTAALEPVQVVSFLPGPYRVRLIAAVRGVATYKAPTGPYRGVGRPISTFVMERLIDMAARRLALDPAEIRRRNLVQAEEFPYKVASGIVWDRSGFLESLTARLRGDRLRRDLRASRPKAREPKAGSSASASPAMPN